MALVDVSRPSEGRHMPSLARWAFRHRRIVVGIWLAVFLGIGALSAGLGTAFKDDFKLPDTESKQALDILQRDFPTASGQSGQIVLHAREGPLRAPQLQQQAATLFTTVSRLPHVVAVQGFDT